MRRSTLCVVVRKTQNFGLLVQTIKNKRISAIENLNNKIIRGLR